MKLSFDSEKSEWTLPEEVLQEHLSRAIVRFEDQKLSALQKRRFVITALFVTCAVIGGTVAMVMGQFLSVIIGAAMYCSAYELSKTYVEGKSQ